LQNINQTQPHKNGTVAEEGSGQWKIKDYLSAFKFIRICINFCYTNLTIKFKKVVNIFI